MLNTYIEVRYCHTELCSEIVIPFFCPVDLRQIPPFQQSRAGESTLCRQCGTWKRKEKVSLWYLPR